jgi:hypothetical protein
MDYSTDDALTGVRLRAYLPAGDQTFTDATLIFLLNEEIQSWAVPFLVKSRSAYLETSIDLPIVASQVAYPVPSQATGGMLRDVQLVDALGNRYPMVQIDVHDLGPFGAGVPFGFYMQGDSIMLAQAPANSSLSLRVTYARTPSDAVLKANCAKVATIAGNVVTFSNVPGTVTAGVAVDWVKGTSSFLTLASTITPTPSGGNYTFTSLPANLAVGDYLCLSNQAPFPQLPTQVHPVLHQRVAAKVLDLMGDDKAKQSLALFQEMANNVQALIAPRVQGAAKPLHGTLTRGVGRFGGLFGGR